MSSDNYPTPETPRNHDVSSFKYWAFISYSHRDKSWGSWLHRRLESYRIPRRLVGCKSRDGQIPARIAPVFRDREELPASSDLGRTVKEALEGARYLIVICSPHAAKSRWVNQEILAFKRMGRSDRIFCFIVDGEPNASDKVELGLEECFPLAARHAVGAEGQLTKRRTAPLAADARPMMDGKNDAKLRLVAGILGVGFDELKRRELQRHVRKLGIVLVSAMAVMAVTIVLAITALVFGAEANRQRIKAAENAETATKLARENGELLALTGRYFSQIARFRNVDLSSDTNVTRTLIRKAEEVLSGNEDDQVTRALELLARAKYQALITRLTRSEYEELDSLYRHVDSRLKLGRGKRAIGDAQRCHQARDFEARNRMVRRAHALLTGLPRSEVQPYLDRIMAQWEALEVTSEPTDEPYKPASQVAAAIARRDVCERILDHYSDGDTDQLITACLEMHSATLPDLRADDELYVMSVNTLFDFLEAQLVNILANEYAVKSEHVPRELIAFRKALDQASPWNDLSRWKVLDMVVREFGSPTPTSV